MIYLTRLFFCAVLMSLLVGSVSAQRSLDDLRMLARFEVIPGTPLRGPYRNTVRFQIGKGTVRAMLRPRMELQIVRGAELVQTIALPKLPVFFDWDSTQVPNGKYALRLIAVDTQTQATSLMDEVQGEVQNAEPEPIPVVSSAGATREAAPSPTAPAPRFERRGSDAVVSGVLSMPIADWPENTASRYLPVVDIYRDGKRVDSQGTGGRFPFVLNWDTSSLPNGVYTLKLTVLNLNEDSETAADEITITIQNTAGSSAPRRITPPVRPVQPPAPKWQKGMFSSRNGLGDSIGLLRGGSKKDHFRWVAMISKAYGDPFPQVAAAQWALESNWGKSTSGRNNYFGIKAVGDQPGTEKATHEWGEYGEYETVARFADYESPAHGIGARVRFLKKPRYSGYWTAASAEAACRALQRGGYATDPAYATKLIKIMRDMGG